MEVNVKQRTCRECGKEITGSHPTQKFCPPTPEQRLKGQKQSRCARLYDRKLERERGPRHELTCENCGTEYLAWTKSKDATHQRHYCSPGCAWEARRVFISGTCPICGDQFTTYTVTPESDRHLPVYCGRGCQRAHLKYLRRAIERQGERVNRTRVYERDGWDCQICGLPIDREAKAPHPMSPSLDHIIPLARGGTHTEANCQAAHLICNVRKGDRPMLPQLALTV